MGKIFVVSSEKHVYLTERIMTVQGQPRSLILVPIESDFLLVISSKLANYLAPFRAGKNRSIFYEVTYFFMNYQVCRPTNCTM